MEKHGGNVTDFSKEIGCTVDEVIDLSSNINFIKPNINIDFNTLNISAYPNYDKLYQAVATRYGIQTSNIEIFNGATVAIHTLFRELNLTHCTLYAPLYSEYIHCAEIYGYKTTLINRFKNLDQEIKEKSLIIFVNPSTPDGNYYLLEKLIKVWISKECTIIIDESFLDFTPYHSAIQYLNLYKKLYILKSMTKFYSSAGIRIGAVFSNPKAIKHIKSKEPLWKISQFDSQYLQSALQSYRFIQNSNYHNKKAKEILIRILKDSPWIEKIYHSDTNFILIKLKKISSKKLQKELSLSKIMVRDCTNFHFLDNSFVRIAIKDKSKLKILKDRLSKIST